MRQLGLDVSAQVAPALMLIVAILALPCAIILTLGLIWWYRRRVARSMQTAAAIGNPEVPRAPSAEPDGALEILRIEPARRAEAASGPVVAMARHHAWQLAGIYAAAAASYAFVQATAFILVFAPDWRSILALTLLYVVYTTELGTPVALAPPLILRRQPRFLVLAVLALIALMWILDRSIGVDSIGLWLLIAAVPAAAVLLLNIRRLRAVGPIVFAGTLLALYGIIVGLSYGALDALDAVGPVRFVREDLVALPLWEAMQRYFAWLQSLPPDRALVGLAALVNNPSGVAVAAHPERLTTGVLLRFFAIWLAAAAVGVAAAWAFVRWLALRYRARRASDQMLSVDVLMLTFALPMVFLYLKLDSPDWPIAAGALAGLASYKLVAGWGLRHRRRTALPPAPRTLLLLRVFGFDRRTQRLLEDLGQRWRYLGPIHLIGGTDLAYATIEPHEFFEFLNSSAMRTAGGWRFRAWRATRLPC
jgi:hypothetical protein